MSFGFSVGDFLAVIELANKIRRDFNGAPDQFKEIAQEVRTLSIVLQDASVNAAQFSGDQADNFQTVLSSCHALLQRLEKVVDKWSDALQHKQGKIVQRIWKRLKWEPEEIRDLRSQLTSRVTLLHTFNDRTTSYNVAKLVRRNDDERQVKLLEWLSPVNYVAQQNYLVGRRQAGSRKWLFDSTLFTQWLAQKGQILYCPGDPGTGKTFTTAMVIEKLQDETQNDSRTLNTYLYCSYKNADQDTHSLLCSLLRNSFQHAGIPDTVFPIYEKRQASGQPLLRDEVLPLLGSLYTSFDRVNILVDALDELPVQVRRPFITELLRLRQNQNLSLFVTSRNIPEIQRPFDDQGAASLEIRASDEDVRQFLMDSLFQLPGFVGRSPALQAEIIQAITEACSGMFLLAELHLSSLKNKKSTTALRSALSCLCVGSDAYDNAYEETVARITALGPDSENLAKQALLILSCARQPLLTEDLAYALSVEPDSETIDEDNVPDIEDVVAVCAGLVVIDKESNVVQLVHKSTQEYFERNRARWFPRANDIMARLCIQYRSMALSRMSSGTRKATKVLPFWRYADANVFHHTLVAEREVEAAGEMTTVSSNAIVLSNVSSTSELALRQLAKDMGGSLQSTLISACRDGRHALVELLLTVNNYEWSQSPNHSGSKVFLSSLRKQLDASQDDVLLTIAARRRDYAMLKILLDQGADPNVVNPFGQTALYIAASNGSESLIALLLEHPSIDLNCECVERHLLPRSFRDEYADKSWAEGILWTPLLVAARAGHLGSVKMLLNRADRRYRDRGGMNVACLAAAIGHCEIIKELLEWSDIEMDPRSNQQHRSALEMAIKRVQHEACQILIPISDVNREYANGNGPLHEAILQRSSKLVQELLSKEGVVINAYGNSPVQLAAEQSFEILFALVRHIGAHGIHDKHWESAQSLLMDKCRSRAHINSLSSILMFDINVRDKFGSAFLHRICVINRISILEAILQKPSIDVNICDRDGNTPLMKAVQHGKCEAIDALLSHSGVLVDTENQAGNTALLIASALISDPDNRFHRTPDAAQHILEKFLRHPDVRKNHQNKAGQTVLTLAVQHGTRPMLQSIIEVTDLAGQFHQIFQNGRTLISYCSEFNTPDTFDFILEESLPHFIDLADNEGRTPLSYAAEAGNYRTMRRLMGIANVRIGLADIKGYTPLDYAIQSGSKEAEIWLLMKGAKKASNKRKATEPLPIRNAKRLEESLE